MFQEMIQEAPFLNEDTTMPPPRKLMRRGSRELEDAVRVGDVKLSLPKQDWQSWVASTDWSSSGQDEKESIDQEASPRLFSTTVSDQTSNAGEITRSRPTAVDGVRRSTEASKSTPPDRRTRNHCDADQCLREDPNAQPSTRGIDCGLPRFSDIVGHNAVKLRLDEVLLPLALPPALADSILVGVRSLSASILLFGPPGCGKTQLANAIAGEAEAAFLSVGPSDILSKFVGESEASIRSLFDKGTEGCTSDKCMQPSTSTNYLARFSQHTTRRTVWKASALFCFSMKSMPSGNRAGALKIVTHRPARTPARDEF